MNLSQYSDQQLQAIIDAENQPAAAEKPSAWQDIKTGAVPWAGQAAANTAGTPAAIADLAASGADWLGSKLPEGYGGETIKKGAEKVKSAVEPYTPASIQKKMEPFFQKHGYDINYEPQTSLGGYVRTAEGFVPAALAAMAVGPEALLPTLARSVGGAVGSEALGQGVENYTGKDSWEGSVARMVGALGGGAVAPRAVTPFPATSAARTTAANEASAALKPFGGDVDAAQATGNKNLRLWQGPQKDQSGPATQALFDKAGIQFNPAGAERPTDVIAREEQAWKQQANAVPKTQQVVPDNQFWKELQQHEADSQNVLHPKYDKQALSELNDAGDELRDAIKAGGKRIDGKKYVQLLEKYRDSNNPYVKGMAGPLQGAAERSPGGQIWDELNERYANLQGLKNASQNAGIEGTIKPGDVSAGMKRNTPLRQTAESMRLALAPVEAAKPTGYASLLGGAGGAALGGLDILPGGLSGGGATGAILGSMLADQGKTAAGRMAQTLMNSRPAQAYFKNQLMLPKGGAPAPLGNYTHRLTPRQAALLLAAPVSQSAQ